ncbi:MAG: PAS domain S-box protein [Spirochaetes bacterium]|nr:PAS domain S-box protein [Spirochaetota bacterium]
MIDNGNTGCADEIVEGSGDFRTLVENFFNGILIIAGEDSRVAISYANRRAAEITGYSVAELLECRFEELSCHGGIEKFMKHYGGGSAEGAVPGWYEAVIIRKDGKSVVVEAAITKTVWQGERADIVHLHDISGRKLAEDALRKSEEKFRQITENMLDAVSLLDKDGIIRYASPSHERILGYKPEDLLGKVSLDLTHPDDVARIIADLETIFEKGEVKIEYRFRHADGYYLWGEALIKIVRDTAGSLAGFVAASRDITARKHAELELENERQRLSYILEGTNAGTWEWNVQTGETIFNERWAEIIGYTLEEIAPVSIETWRKFVHPDDLKKSDELLKKHFKGELKYYECEARMRHKDGGWVWVLDRGKVSTWTNEGQPLIMSGTHQNITDRKKAEEQIRKNLEEKDVLLKEIHHRVKNNLTVISSFLNLQAKQIETKEDALGAFKESRDRVFAMALVHDRLYGSRDFTHIDMKSYIEEMVEQLFKMYCGPQVIRYEIDVSETSIDLNRAIPCGLILNELITNALKYAFPAGRMGTISVSFQPFEKTLYELAVSDDGIGLPENFDIEHSQSLGLNIVRMLTVQLNGSWHVSRQHGTSFSVRFHREAG